MCGFGALKDESRIKEACEEDSLGDEGSKSCNLPQVSILFMFSDDLW